MASVMTYFRWQFRLPRSEVQKLARVDNAEAHKRVLESFARDLPISNR